MSIYDTIKSLSRLNQEDWSWLESHPVFIKAQREGKGVYLTDHKGGNTEYLTTESWLLRKPIEGEDIAVFSMNDIEAYFKINVVEPDEMSDAELDVKYPTSVFTASGKLVHLAV